MASSNLGAQIAVRPSGNSQCPHHIGKELVYICEDCGGLACTECVSTEHKKHALVDLSNAIPNIEGKIQDFIHKTQKNIPPTKEKIQAVNEDLLQNRQHYEKIIREVKAENEYVKKELDRLTESYVEACQDMKQENEDTLLNHRAELQARLDEMNVRIQKCTDSLQKGNVVQIYDTAKHLKEEFKKLPTKPELAIVQFLPSITKLPQLQQLLGELLVKRPAGKPKQIQLKYQTAKWSVTSPFTPYQHHKCVTSMNATPSDHVWVSRLKQNTMLLTDQTGQIHKELNVGKVVDDFCLSPTTQNIWYINSEKRSVTATKDGRHSEMFQTENTPLSICLTTDDHIIIGHERQLVKYSANGKAVTKTSPGGMFTTPPVRYPVCISECPVTHNLAVVDKDLLSYGGEGKPFVSVLNDKLQVLYTYHGETSGHQSLIFSDKLQNLLNYRGDRPKPKYLPRSFTPSDVCYTRRGELVVTDQYATSVQLLSGQGEFLRTLYTHHTSSPVAVSVCRDNTLFVSFDDGNVHVLKRTSQAKMNYQLYTPTA